MPFLCAAVFPCAASVRFAAGRLPMRRGTDVPPGAGTLSPVEDGPFPELYGGTPGSGLSAPCREENISYIEYRVKIKFHI